MPEKPQDTKTKKGRTKQDGIVANPASGAPDDTNLWDKFAEGIAPLKGRKKVSHTEKALLIDPPPTKKRLKYMKMEGPPPIPPSATITTTAENRPQIDKRTRNKFEKGDFPIDGKIDLHGMSEDRAHSALSRFLTSHIAAGARCLLVVTGQGRNVKTGVAEGVLQKNLPLWVLAPRFAPHVLSVTHAHKKHGGRGAYYILLRRKRSEI